MTPTNEQQMVIEATSGSLKMIAYAGTGKTSTFVGRANARPRERALYLAFNKSVEQEAQQRFPRHVTPRTQHGLAFGTIMRGSRYVLGKLSIFKTSRVLRTDFYFASLTHKTIETFCASAEAEIAMCHVADDVIKRLNYDVKPVILDLARKVWAMMIEGRHQDFPMTHSGYLKLYQLSRPRLGYDVIMLDEAQDTNPVVQDIVLRQAQFGTKIFLAGDPYQQIYAWRGAVDALDKIQADTFYLTQSFRFGKQIAGAANCLLNTFFGEDRPLVGLGPEGIISEIPAKPPYTFLARTNAFLFARASALAGKFRLYTPSGGQGSNLALFDSVLNVYALWKGKTEDIRDPELRFFRDFAQLKEFANTGSADPEYVICVAIVEKYQDGLPAQIDKIRASLVPSPDLAEVTLITAHRAKGLEWDTVVLCDDFAPLYDEDTGQLRPLGLDRETEVAPDEINLLYVAATRAKRCLVPNKELHRLLSEETTLLETPPAPLPAPFAAS